MVTTLHTEPNQYNILERSLDWLQQTDATYNKYGEQNQEEWFIYQLWSTITTIGWMVLTKLTNWLQTTMQT
jgi:hypothetical protein